MRPGRREISGAALALAAVAFSAHGLAWATPLPTVPNEPTIPDELTDVGIEDKVGTMVPVDVRLRDQNGHPVVLRDYLSERKPLLLVMAYYECPMLCSLVINGLVEGMRSLSWNAGEEYRTIVVSFDPRDTTEIAAAKRTNYATAYGREIKPHGFDFLIGDEAEVHRLSSAVGFKFRYDAESKQFAHAAGLFAITPDGKLSRTLYGISFPRNDLQLALAEASLGKLGGVVARVLLFCFHYDPEARGYVLASIRLMKGVGMLTVLALAWFLARLFRAERLRPNGPVGPSPAKGTR